MKTMLLAGVALAFPLLAHATSYEIPGPDAQLWQSPKTYACSTNLFVSTAGSDTTGNGSSAAPWASLQKANDSLPTNGSAAGTCINVAPGAYSGGVNITAGGNYAGPNGYVAYRCTGYVNCQIFAVGKAFSIVGAPGPSYVVVDGFELIGNSAAYPNGAPYGVGFYVNDANGLPSGAQAGHHFWVLNSKIHGFGEAGVGTNEADYVYVMHSETYGNANVTCDAQGSGIGFVVPKAVANYTPTAADLVYAPYHQVVAYTISHDNILTQCGSASAPYDTDGNGIIMDTFNGAGIDNVLYPNQTLLTNNVTYDNGGKGIQIFRSGYVTVANNTAYNNNLDPWNAGFPRGEINNLGGWSNSYYNNVVISLPAASPSDPRCQGADYDIQPAPCPLMANVSYLDGNFSGIPNTGETWQHNINLGGNPPWGGGPGGNDILNQAVGTFDCTSNKCNTDPLFVNGPKFNFALQAASPAIGYGLAISGVWQPAQYIDAGACWDALTTCY